MNEILEHLNRNKNVVVQVGEPVTNLSAGLETCIRLDQRTINPKAAIAEGNQSNTDSGSISEPLRTYGAASKRPSRLKPHAAFKIYSKALEAARNGKPGDRNFFPAQKEWIRLCHDLHVVVVTHRRLLPCAFHGSALAIYEAVAADNLHSTAE